MPSGHSCQQKPISWQFVYTYRIVKKWTDLICQRRQDAEVSSTEHNSNWRSWLLRLTTASSVVRPHTRLYSRVLVVHSSPTHIYLPIWTLSALSTHAVNIVPHTNIPVYWPFSRESGTTRVSRYRKVQPIWILLKQETVSGNGISWAICKSAPRSRQITMPAPHHSVFYRPDAIPAAQPTASKHWRDTIMHIVPVFVKILYVSVVHFCRPTHWGVSPL